MQEPQQENIHCFWHTEMNLLTPRPPARLDGDRTVPHSVNRALGHREGLAFADAPADDAHDEQERPRDGAGRRAHHLPLP